VEIEKKIIIAIATMMRALANETRLSILYKLYEKPRTWTELIFELKINPKSLKDHLEYLKKSHLVRKRKPVGFELTDSAKEFIESSFKDIISVVKETTMILEQRSENNDR